MTDRKFHLMDKAEIGGIRLAIFERQNHLCLWCGKLLTWEQAHMHELLSRGKGGKISLDNSIILCYDDHINRAHGNRKPQWRKA